MRGDLTFFKWPVAKNGYVAVKAYSVHALENAGVDAVPFDGIYITDGLPAELGFVSKIYSPLDQAGLFMEFAALQDSEVTDLPTKTVAFVDFANKYGLLGGTIATLIMIPNPDKPGSLMSAHGEEYWAWKKEIAAMRDAVALYKAVRDSDRATLKKLINWEKGAVKYISDFDYELIASETIHPERLQRFGDPYIGPALYRLQVTINQKLKISSTSARLIWNRDKQTLELHLIPTSLLGCLWLQLANAVAGSKEFRQCLYCKSWFDISQHAGRSDKKFCNPSCKAAHHRIKVEKKTREFPAAPVTKDGHLAASHQNSVGKVKENYRRKAGKARERTKLNKHSKKHENPRQ
jgi:hypothetical protein